MSSTSSSSSRSSSPSSSGFSRPSSRSSSRSSSASPPPIPDSEQYELDSAGHPVRTSHGYKSAKRVVVRRYLHRDTILKPFEPGAFDTLPPELLVYPKKPHNNRKHYHFGIGISYERLWEYCIAHNLAPKHYQENPLCSSAMVDAAVQQLDRLCGAKLQLCGITHLKHQYVLSRYSNYTWFKEKLSDRDEEEVVAIIHRELDICEPPRWYHKLVRSPSGYGLF